MDGLVILIGGGLFSLFGGLITHLATRKRNNAEVKRLEEETEKLNLENQKLSLEYQKIRQEQTNSVMKENNELVKAKEELKAKLYITNEEKLLLAKELSIYRIESTEKQKRIDALSEKQKKFEELLTTHSQDIVAIKKTQTGQLPARSDLNNNKE